MGAKCRRMASQIFRYAAQTARATSDPAALLVGAIKSPDTKHRATVPLKEMPALLKTIAAVPAELNTRLAFYWLLLTAARTGEMRFATWGEIEDGKLWRVPAERMKMQPRAPRAAVEAGASRCSSARANSAPGPTPIRRCSSPASPGTARCPRTPCSPCSPAPATSAGRPRTDSAPVFSTWAHEVHEADPDVIEACLAHVKEGVRGIYNRATYLSKRAALLQAWADQCTAWGMTLP